MLSLLLSLCPHDEHGWRHATDLASCRSENDFPASDEEDLAPYNSNTVVTDYLKLESEMEIHNCFPTIKSKFIKFNIATPSSAPV